MLGNSLDLFGWNLIGEKQEIKLKLVDKKSEKEVGKFSRQKK